MEEPCSEFLRQDEPGDPDLGCPGPPRRARVPRLIITWNFGACLARGLRGKSGEGRAVRAAVGRLEEAGRRCMERGRMRGGAR